MERGHWEINVAATLDSSSHESQTELPHYDLNYGLGEHTQLKYESGFARFKSGGDEAVTGLEPALVGVKYRFVDAASEKEGLSISVYPQVGFHGLFSSDDADVAARGTQWIIPVEIKEAIGTISTDVEIGRTITDGVPSNWLYGLAGGYSPIESLKLLAEIHGETPTGRSGTGLVNVGARCELTERIEALVAFGRSLKSTGQDVHSLAYVGVGFHL